MASNEFSGGAYASSGGGQYRPSTSAPKKTSPIKTPSKESTERYAKPKAMAGLPGWAKEIRAGSNFMPVKVKPMSYNYMAIAETKHRAVPYTAPTATQTTIGNAYFKPTNEVAAGISKQHNLWQDIKNIGGKIVHKGGSLLMGAIDILQRPGYMVRNVYKTYLEDHYTDPGKDGKGADVTGWEALLGVASMLSPVAAITDIATGKFDDRLKAAGRGLAGKDKTSIHNILELTNPEFVKEHKTATTILSLIGDIATDPITWVTMGVNPGSVAKGLGSGIHLATGDKAAAARLWEETLFTAQGRKAGVEVVRKDIQNREVRRLQRKQRRTGNQLTKAEAGQVTKLNKTALEVKQKELGKAIADKTAEHLVGSQLAAKIFKKSLPTLGLITLSRLNTGAGASTAFKGAETLKTLMEDFHAGVASRLKDSDPWNAFYAANQNKDFTYTYNGKPYTVKLSESKDLEDFINKVSKEANAIAAYAEHGAKAARGRRGRNVAVDARGKAFIDQFRSHVEDRIVAGIGDEAIVDAFDAHRGLINHVERAPAMSDDFLNDAAKTKGLARISQHDIHNADVDTSVEALRKQAKAEHKKLSKAEKKTDQFKENKDSILVEGVDGKYRKISLAAAERDALREGKIRKGRLEDRVHLGQRSREQAAMDRLSGVSDNVAAARATFLAASAKLAAARETASAADVAELVRAKEAAKEAVIDMTGATKAVWETEVPEQAKKVYNTMKDIIYNSNEFSKAEQVKYSAILEDASMPMEERISKILQDRGMSNDEAEEVLKKTFDITISDDGVIHLPRGGTLENIPDIVKAVIRDRFAKRVTQAMTDASGVRLEDKPLEDIFRIVADGKNPNATNYMKDVNGEIGMMVLDGYRAAAQYAMKTDLWKDPEALFDSIHTSMSELMNTMTADMKAQVGSILYHNTGLRLPDEFVPKLTDIDDLLGKKNLVWKNADGTLSNQEIPWQELGMHMQKWVDDTFSFFKTDSFSGNAKSGLDMEQLKARIKLKAKDVIKPPPDNSTKTAMSQRKINRLTPRIRYLETLVEPAPINGTVGAVNRYNMLDFIMHEKEIIKAHSNATKISSGTARLDYGRLSALDSFTYTDEVTVDALNAISELKTMANSKHLPTAELVQRQLTALFAKHGGLDFIDNVKMPASGNLADLDFTKPFSTLGAHARLKERVVSTSGFGTPRQAEILEAMWGQQSLVHEWQKSFQNAILHETFVKGRTPEQAARVMQTKIDNIFGPYDDLKKRIYPNKQGAIADDLALEGRVGAAPAAEAVPPGAAKAVAPAVEKLMNVKKAQTSLEESRKTLQEAITAVKVGPKDDPALLAEVDSARTAYIKAQEVAKSKANATGKEGEVTPPVSSEDPADFANVGTEPLKFTEEEREVIRKYIGATYADAPPQAVAKQIHTLSMAISADVLQAQSELMTGLQSFNFKYGASVRFMGIPFMPMVNPMNATHTAAGVVTLNEEASRATKFWNTLYGPEARTSWGQKAHKYMTKRSHMFEGTLDQISTSVVNAASTTRQRVFTELNELYKIAVEDTEYLVPQINNMSRQKKFEYIRAQIFNPTQPGVPDALEQFKLADGSNPIREIVANMDASAVGVFKSNTPKDRWEEILKYNRYMDNKFRLDTSDDAVLKTAMLTDGHPLNNLNLVPYTREWFQEVSKLPEGMKVFSAKELLKINLGELHTALHDAKIKLNAGTKLHEGVFSQFAFRMDPSTANMYNSPKFQESMLDVNGKQLRGELANVKDLEALGISKASIPLEFKSGEYYIDKEIVSDIKVLFDYMEDKHNINTTVDMHFMDKVLNHFKASVTIYKIPTYPVRNLVGDVFMSAMDGLVDARYYKDAGSLMRDHHDVMKRIDTKEYAQLVDQNFLKDEIARAAHDPAMQPGAHANPTPFKLKLNLADGPVEVNGSQIMDSYFSLGLGQNHTAGNINEAVSAARQTGMGKSLGGIHDKLRDLNSVREDWGRLSHFLYAIEREAPLGGTFEDVIRRAGNRVIKYHFDYSDVSLFDKMTLGRVIPFYKWTKNIVPFTIANMVTKPWAIKAEQAVGQTLSYLIDDDKADRRTDYVVPEWIQYDSAVPIGSYTDANGYKFGQWASMYMPMSDTLKRTLGPIAEPMMDPAVTGFGNTAIKTGEGALGVGVSMFNPIYKSVIQGATQREVWPSGPAPQKGDWFSTLAGIIPGYAAADPIIRDLTGRVTDKTTNTTGKNQMGDLLEQLGVINVSNNSEASQLGELKRSEDYYRPQLNNAKADLMNRIQKQYPETTPEERTAIVDQFLKITRKGDPLRL